MVRLTFKLLLKFKESRRSQRGTLKRFDKEFIESQDFDEDEYEVLYSLSKFKHFVYI